MKEAYGRAASTLLRPRVLGGASRGVRRSVDRGIGGPGDRAPITDEPGADTVCLWEGNIRSRRQNREPARDAAWSKTLARRETRCTRTGRPPERLSRREPG